MTSAARGEPTWTSGRVTVSVVEGNSSRCVHFVEERKYMDRQQQQQQQQQRKDAGYE